MRPAPTLTEFPRYPIAAGICLLAIVVTAASWLGKDVSPLYETAMIRRGELWRLLTSALPHDGILHLLFNVYWIWVFGTLLEQVFGPIKTAGLILLFAAVPNALEFAFFIGGIGLSGVGYGFFGLLWVLASRDDRFRDAIDPMTVQVFIAWFFICIVTTVMGVMLVANVAHGAGAVLGILVGFAIAKRDRRFAIVAGIAGIVLLSLGAATLWRPRINLSGRQGYEEGRWGYDALISGRNQEAVRWFRDAVAYQPKSAAYWFDLGIAYERLNDKPASLNAYRKAADLGSAEARAYLSEMYTTGSTK